MLLLPVAHPLSVLLVAEVISVLRLGQPRLLCLAFPGFAAFGFSAIALVFGAPALALTGMEPPMLTETEPSGEK
jgi:hypothetical protein